MNAYPYALDFIANRKEAGECEINGKPVGVIGQPREFMLFILYCTMLSICNVALIFLSNPQSSHLTTLMK